MKNRTEEIHIRLTKEEADDLKRKAELCRLTQSALLRMLLKGYEPREAPDGRFYEVMEQLYAIGNNLNQLTRKANALGWVDSKLLTEQVERLTQFQLEIEQAFLLPAKSLLKWK